MVEELFRSLYAEGQLDSRGVFTVDWERARQKMGRFGLATPAHALLRMVQAGLRSGAVEVHLDFGPRMHRCRLEYPEACPWTPAPITRLLSGQPAESGGADLDYLTAALATWMTGPLAGLRLLGAGLRVQGEGPRLSVESAPKARETFELEVEWSKPLPAPDLGEVALSPVPILYRGALVNRPLGLPAQGGRRLKPFRYDVGRAVSRSGWVAEWYLVNRSFSPQLLVVPAVSPCLRQRWTPVTGLVGVKPGPDLASVATGRAPGLSFEGRSMVACHAALIRTGLPYSQTVFVRDGVAVDYERNLFDRPGLTAMVSARDVNLDLAGQVVHDGAFRRVVDFLRQGCLWMYD
ncbi:MAG: hypothetical protein AB1758_20850 [Candidatus Eremiobacterota bacterium]